MPRSFDALLAHQGSWDEILLFGVPVVVALAAVRFVERRHRKDPAPEQETPVELPAPPDGE
jgi:hypothetical protein